ncbi:uncharacterized protein [Leptinotarsa decemlineata]|uniref:uncharacterized protein n=1 Tax=Leptinotarsa decemlineata TaxID=7539 RepID=UPI003D309A2E
MGDKVRESILNRVKEAKYFALILDCTPDLSRKEQLSVIFRYVHEKSDKTVEICESFVDFVEITDTTGKGLSETVFKALENYGLDIQNCRGQGYDNGANMKGKYSGLQKRIIEQNKRAFFVSSGCHSLNLVQTKELAEELKVEAKFKAPRLRGRKKHFDFEVERRDEHEPLTDPQEKFKVEFFLPLVDTAKSAVEERFEQLNAKTSKFEFLFNLDKLPDRQTLLIKCQQLEELMSDGADQSDIRGAELCDELVSIQKLLPKEGQKSPMDVLNFLSLTESTDAYVNLWIALRIISTMPMSVASSERSFSKLKLIKTYVRSTLSQKRLNSLSILSIENELSQSVDYLDIVNSFSEMKARKALV